eukprot:GHVP01053321.1.p1 GENE.GHVP01053321.1~~GHVP01053321.1.p1  ORF type:complete len:120 (+),score=13.23 GHVP01053321.1:24-362(+)
MTAWNFLVDLGKELGKEFEMSQFVTILEDNWIDPQSFCKISDEQLVRLGIPLGLIIKIRDRIRNQETTDRASATKDGLKIILFLLSEILCLDYVKFTKFCIFFIIIFIYFLT